MAPNGLEYEWAGDVFNNWSWRPVGSISDYGWHTMSGFLGLRMPSGNCGPGDNAFGCFYYVLQ